MARAQLELPDNFVFETAIIVRVSDLNYGGHVGNDAILTIMQDARVLFYRSKGFKDEISFEGDIGQIITDAIIIYRSESFLGDTLIVKIAIEEVTKYGFDMLYLMENKDTGKEVARGKTGIVCFDYVKRKVATMPDALRYALLH